MDWSDEGFVLSARRHGENALIVSLLTLDHGRHAGLVRGGAGARSRGIYQPGNLVRSQWRARLAEHLGTYRCELAQAIAAIHLHAPLPLLALSAATTLVAGFALRLLRTILRAGASRLRRWLVDFATSVVQAQLRRLPVGAAINTAAAAFFLQNLPIQHTIEAVVELPHG